MAESGPIWQRRAGRNTPVDGSEVGAVLADYMIEHGLSQGQLAALLGYERTYISKILSGVRQIRRVEQLREIALALGIPAERFGLFLSSDEGLRVGRGERRLPSIVRDDESEWRLVRQALNRRRPELTKLAASLYPSAEHVLGTTLITQRAWNLEQPVALDGVQLDWDRDALAPAITGGEAESESCRPLAPHGGRYARYSHAIRELDRPTLFENRMSYRLLDLVSGPEGIRHVYGPTTYFDMVDVCEAVAHELAAVWLRTNGRAGVGDLPFRSLVGDPFDLTRRPVLPSIDTLTLRQDRRGGTTSFMLHRRNARNVAVAGGMSHVMPAGVFQPSGVAPWNVAADFDLWRNILRELSEEFLGNPEHDGSSGQSIDYDAVEPFRSLNDARAEGLVRVWAAGVALDPLTLACEILTVLVIDAEVFDDVFAGLVEWNSEGDVVSSGDGSAGIPWRRDTVFQILMNEPLAPAAAGLIEYAWKHQEVLLH